eukprot:2144447-Lingulodinium_polyedra.AAC.1
MVPFPAVAWATFAQLAERPQIMGETPARRRRHTLAALEREPCNPNSTCPVRSCAAELQKRTILDAGVRLGI